jgi:hypothetical protein
MCRRKKKKKRSKRKMVFFKKGSLIVSNLLSEQPITKAILINKIQLLTTLPINEYSVVFVVFNFAFVRSITRVRRIKSNLINLSYAMEFLEKKKKIKEKTK